MTCTAINVHVELISFSNPYGEVRAAELTLRGRTRPIVWVVKPERSKHPLRLVPWDGTINRNTVLPEPATDVAGRFMSHQIGA